MTDKTEWRTEKHPKFDVWRVVGDGMTISGLDEPTAHLIAAAREMRNALENVDGWIMDGWSVEDVESGSVNPAFRKALKTTRAALAKSRGET